MFTSSKLLELNESGPVGIYTLESLLPLVNVLKQISELVDVDGPASVSIEHVCEKAVAAKCTYAA